VSHRNIYRSLTGRCFYQVSMGRRRPYWNGPWTFEIKLTAHLQPKLDRCNMYEYTLYIYASAIDSSRWFWQYNMTKASADLTLKCYYGKTLKRTDKTSNIELIRMKHNSRHSHLWKVIPFLQEFKSRRFNNQKLRSVVPSRLSVTIVTTCWTVPIWWVRRPIEPYDRYLIGAVSRPPHWSGPWTFES